MNRLEKLIVAVLMVFPLQAMAQVNEDLFIYKTVTCIDVDSLKHLIEKAKNDLAHMEEVREGIKADIYEMLNQGKASTEQQQKYLNEAFSLYVDRGGGLEQKTSIGLTALGAALGSKQRISYTSSKTQNKVKKAVEKKKVHEELCPILNEMLRPSTEEIVLKEQADELFQKLKELADENHNLQESEREQSLKQEIRRGDYGMIVKTVPYRIANVVEGLKDRSQFYLTDGGERKPSRSSWLWLWLNYRNDDWTSLITNNLTKGWEWANDENKLEYKEEHYPFTVNYYMSPEHPEYAVIDGAIYDKKGNLIRVIKCFNADGIDMKWGVVKMDYLANKYNIQSAPKKTKDYLKKKVGLSPLTAEEEKQIDKMVEEGKQAMIADMKVHLATTSRGKRIAKENADRKGKKFAFSLLDVMLESDIEGDKFIRQIEKDHRHDFQINYYVERIDNLSFKVKYINCGNTGDIYVAKVWFTQKGKFAYKMHSELIGVEKENVIIDEFIDPQIGQPMHGSLSDLRSRESM